MKLVLLALTAMLVLAMGVGTASALRSISVNISRDRATSSALVFASPEIEGFAITCEVSLEIEEVGGAIAKRRSAKIGNVIGARVASERCRGGEARALEPTRAAPWEIQYESFEGTLPFVRLITVSLHGTGFLTSLLGSRCLFGGTANGSMPVSLAEVEREREGREREIRSITALSTPAVPLVRDLRGLIACPRNGNFAGSFTLERPIRIILI